MSGRKLNIKLMVHVVHKLSQAPGGGEGVLGEIFAGYVPLACQNPYPIIVNFWSVLLPFIQGTKKFRSDSPGLVDFVVGLVEFILHLPDGQVGCHGNFSLKLINRSTVRHQKFSG